jgi:hypothetical protein
VPAHPAPAHPPPPPPKKVAAAKKPPAVKAWAAGTPGKVDTSQMKVLGEGANRRVFDAGDHVIKVAKNAQAKKDNRMEAESSGKHPLLARVVEHGDKGGWVKQEKLKPTTHAEMAKHFGVSAADQKKTYSVQIKDAFGLPTMVHGKDWLFAATHAANGTDLGEVPKSAKKYIEKLQELKKAVPKLDLTDLAYHHQWGTDAEGQHKIADYGFTG